MSDDTPRTTRLHSTKILEELHDFGCVFLPTDKYHFVGTSGEHLGGYCNFDRALRNPWRLSEYVRLIVDEFKGDEIDTVLVPAVGAIPLGQWGAYHLSKLLGYDIQAVWADKTSKREFTLDRDGFADAIRGKRVVILEDFINRMYTVSRVVKLARQYDAELVGIGALATNQVVTAALLDVPKLVALCDVYYDTWLANDCELCEKNIPIVADIGHGEKFEQENPDYPGGYIKLLS